MRLIEELERQTGYLIFIRSNHVSFYMCTSLFLLNCFPYFFNTTTHFSQLFLNWEMPSQNSRLFPDRRNPVQSVVSPYEFSMGCLQRFICRQQSVAQLEGKGTRKLKPFLSAA